MEDKLSEPIKLEKTCGNDHLKEMIMPLYDC